MRLLLHFIYNFIPETHEIFYITDCTDTKQIPPSANNNFIFFYKLKAELRIFSEQI